MHKNIKVIMASAIAAFLTFSVILAVIPGQAFAMNAIAIGGAGGIG
jgi:hypothetical protein